jgi:hypothetical protein
VFCITSFNRGKVPFCMGAGWRACVFLCSGGLRNLQRNVTLYSPVGVHRCFRGMYGLYLKGPIVKRIKNVKLSL